MDPIWIVFAFGFGFSVKQIGLPPLVGYLMAGFALNLFGVEQSPVLEQIADFGVLLLLFTIGLKLRIKHFLKPIIWAGSSIHMMVTVLVFGAIITILAMLGISKFADLSLSNSFLIAFALSFSSTIFAVKILEETGSMKTSHGRLAIGILVMQDIFAVVFLTLSSGKTPSPWALALLLLIFVPKLIKNKKFAYILDHSGHGELNILLGVLLPMVGAALFNLAGLKADLGALVFGIVIAEHSRAEELANTMMGFKDLFLVGFFLSIGLSGIPSMEAIGLAVLLALLMPLKTLIYFIVFTRFKIRARTASLSSFSLSNYSEFGLIVGAAGVAHGWITNDWLITFAVALSLTFIMASPLNVASERVFAKLQHLLLKFETEERLLEDHPIVFSDEEVIVFGMGRTGSEVYRVMEQKFGKKVLGVDSSLYNVEEHKSQGLNVIQGDVMDLNFWQRINMTEDHPLIILATPNHATNMHVIEQLDEIHCSIKVAALSRYDDEMLELQEAGVDVVFNLYEEAGFGFADHTYKQIFAEDEPPVNSAPKL